VVVTVKVMKVEIKLKVEVKDVFSSSPLHHTRAWQQLQLQLIDAACQEASRAGT
jgi:hypothetical protein